MADQPSSPVTQIVQDLLAKNLTKVGVVGGMGFFVMQVALALLSKDWKGALNMAGYLFLMLIPAGMAWSTHKGISALIESEAEKRIVNPSLPSESNVTAVQRAIDKQVASSPASAAQAAPERHTPLNGTSQGVGTGV